MHPPLIKPSKLFAATLGTAAWCASLGGTLPSAHAENNGAALTPPMGWSSWSALRQGPTDARLRDQADAMANKVNGLSLKDAGYTYINLDDFWYQDPNLNVDFYGRWLPSSDFPDLKGLADYIHNKGLKFGIYITPGISVLAYRNNYPIEGTNFHAQDIVSDTSTYATSYRFGGSMYNIDWNKNPGAAQAFLNSWAKLFASYGVDYVKIDGVGKYNNSEQLDEQNAKDVIGWSNALRNSGRTIHLELSNTLRLFSQDKGKQQDNSPDCNAQTWKNYSNGWRISDDVESYGSTLTDWTHVNWRFDNAAEGWIYYSGPGGWTDLDSLELGNGNTDGLSVDERRTTMTLWSIVASPLILGSDLTKLDTGTDFALMTNPEVLAINQAGVQGAPIAFDTTNVTASKNTQVWRARQPSGAYAVALFNRSGSTATVSVNWTSLGFQGAASVRDLWSRSELGSFSSSFSATLNSHACRFLLVTPQTPVARSLAASPANTLSGGAQPNPPVLLSLGTNDANTTTNGTVVGNVGYNGTLGFNVVANVAGSHNITILYTNGDSVARNATVSVNGAAVSNLSFAATGSYGHIGSQSVSLSLKAGSNTITFSNPNGWAPDFDSIAVQATSTPAISGKVCTIVNKKTGQAVDNNNSTQLGTGVVQWTLNNGNTQRWTFTQNPDATWKITNALSGYVLEDPASSTDNDKQMDQWVSNGGDNQKWLVILQTDGTYEIQNQASGKVLDGSSNTTNGYKLSQWPWNNGDQQHWKLQVQ